MGGSVFEVWAVLGLVATNLGTIGAFAFYIYTESREKQKTINALIAKSSQDFINNEMVDKTQKIKVEPNNDIDSDLATLSELTDQEFDEKILN